jgi:hypothetical protein
MIEETTYIDLGSEGKRWTITLDGCECDIEEVKEVMYNAVRYVQRENLPAKVTKPCKGCPDK